MKAAQANEQLELKDFWKSLPIVTVHGNTRSEWIWSPVKTIKTIVYVYVIIWLWHDWILSYTISQQLYILDSATTQHNTTE